MSLYQPVGWANDETHPMSQDNMKTLDAGIVGVAGGEVAYTSRTDGDLTVTGVGDADSVCRTPLSDYRVCSLLDRRRCWYPLVQAGY